MYIPDCIHKRRDRNVPIIVTPVDNLCELLHPIASILLNLFNYLKQSNASISFSHAAVLVRNSCILLVLWSVKKSLKPAKIAY